MIAWEVFKIISINVSPQGEQAKLRGTEKESRRLKEFPQQPLKVLVFAPLLEIYPKRLNLY